MSLLKVSFVLKYYKVHDDEKDKVVSNLNSEGDTPEKLDFRRKSHDGREKCFVRVVRLKKH